MNEKKAFADYLNDRLLQLWNEEDYAVLDEFFTRDFVRYEPRLGVIEGREAMAGHVALMRIQYPDLMISAIEKVFDGRTYVCRWRFQGTDLGEVPTNPFPPTGEKVDFCGTSIFHFEDDCITDEHVYYNLLTVLQQTGVLPETA